jgi:hypothetical protein
MSYYDAQLVIGPHEAQGVGQKEVLYRLERYLERVPTRRLMIWNSQGEQWFDLVVALCRRYGVRPYLWYPLLADRLDGAVPAGERQVHSATRQRGSGVLGAWEGLEGGDENFLFFCGEHAFDLSSSIEEMQVLCSQFGFDGVFLDRIRYPSPANGLEMLFSCFCDRCSDVYQDQLQSAHKALERMVSACLDGAVMQWEAFVREAGLTALMKRRSSVIQTLVSQVRQSLDCSVGLDLFTPALAPLVGQDYRALAGCCDWIKAMTYTKAMGPAGLPLEIRSLIEGLMAAHRQITEDAASLWVEGLLQLSEGSVSSLLDTGALPLEVLEGEILRSVAAAEGRADVAIGIELVDHPLFPTKITADEGASMIQVVEGLGLPLIACWNLLYIPQATYHILGK